MVLPDSHGIPRVPWYSGTETGVAMSFGYGAITLCGRPFQDLHLDTRLVTPRI